MSWEEVRIWGLYVVFFVQMVFQFIGWLARRSLATPDQLAALRSEVHALKGDLEEKIRIERSRIHEANTNHKLLDQRVSAMPDYDEIESLRSAVSKLTAETTGLSENVKSLDRSLEKIDSSVTRIEQTLLDGRRAV